MGLADPDQRSAKPEKEESLKRAKGQAGQGLRSIELGAVLAERELTQLFFSLFLAEIDPPVRVKDPPQPLWAI